MSTLKEKVLQNIKGNIEDQCPDDSYFYSWSASDRCNKTSLVERQTRLTSVIELFCTEQLHTVSRYTNQKEEDIEPSLWEGSTVKINYPKKIDCSEDELKVEFEKAWPLINRIWMKHVNLCKEKHVNQLGVWKEVISHHTTEFPSFVKLIQIMIATSPNTSDVERGYSQLQMITEKRRNHLNVDNIESLFILATLKLPLMRPSEYINEIECLEKKH